MRKGAGLFWQISHLMIFKNNKEMMNLRLLLMGNTYNNSTLWKF